MLCSAGLSLTLMQAERASAAAVQDDLEGEVVRAEGVLAVASVLQQTVERP